MAFEMEEAQEIDEHMGNIMEDEDMKLTWNLQDINREFHPGTWEGKLKPLMFVQILLVIYYAISFVLTFFALGDYYAWPPVEEGDETHLLEDGMFVRTDELSFECDGIIYYRECQGPMYEESPELLQNCTATFGGDSPATFLPLATFLAYIFAFVAFCLYRLYRGWYNQLQGFVTFESLEDNQQNIVRDVKPVKFAVAFTLLCNLSRGSVSVLLGEACGRLTFLHLERNIFLVLVTLVNLLFVCVGCLGLLVYFINFCFCQSTEFCCTERKGCVFFIIRALVRVIVVTGLILRFASLILHFNVDFDFAYPNWAACSIISFLDLLASFLLDAYIKGWHKKVGMWLQRED